MTKNVACTFSFFKIAKIWAVEVPYGPSSNVKAIFFEEVTGGFVTVEVGGVLVGFVPGGIGDCKAPQPLMSNKNPMRKRDNFFIPLFIKLFVIH
jgi:hypothetical protein